MLRFNFAEVTESTFEKYLRADILFIILVAVSVFAALNFAKSRVQEEIANLDINIKAFEAEKRRLKDVRKIEKTLREKKKELEFKLSVFDDLNRKRKVPDYLYFFANSNNMENVWLLSLSSRGNIQLTGFSRGLNNLHRFLRTVENRFNGVTMEKTFFIPVFSKTDGIYKFDLKIHP